MSLDKYNRTEKNPFIDASILLDLKDKNTRLGTKRPDDNVQVIDKGTGEIRDSFSYTYTKQRVDASQFIKLYTHNMRSIFGLPKRCLLVLGYIFKHMIQDKDFVYIHVSEVMDECSYKGRQSVYTALTDLLKAEVIARTREPYMFWINPNIMYNGSRLVIINEYIKQREGEEIKKIEEGTFNDKETEKRFKQSNLNK